MNNNELYHYGVLGMKWGVRRYQPYSTTGPRKGGKTGKEVGEAAKVESRDEIKRRKAQSKADKKAVQKEKAKRAAQSKADKKEARKEARLKKKEAKKAERIEKERQDILNDPKKLSKNLDKFSPKEINDAIERINLKNRLRDARIEDMNTGKRYIDMVLGYADSVKKAYGIYTSISGMHTKNMKDKYELEKLKDGAQAAIEAGSNKKETKKEKKPKETYNSNVRLPAKQTVEGTGTSKRSSNPFKVENVQNPKNAPLMIEKKPEPEKVKAKVVGSAREDNERRFRDSVKSNSSPEPRVVDSDFVEVVSGDVFGKGTSTRSKRERTTVDVDIPSSSSSNRTVLALPGSNRSVLALPGPVASDDEKKKKLKHSAVYFVPNKDELYHHGILGMKWGIRRFQPYGHGGYDPKNKGKEVGEAAKKPVNGNSDKGLSSTTSTKELEKTLTDNGFKIDRSSPYGPTARKKLKTKDAQGNNRQVDLSIDIDLDYKRKYNMPDEVNINELNKVLDDVSNNFQSFDNKIRKDVADDLFSGRTPWKYDESSLSIEDQKKDFIKNLGNGDWKYGENEPIYMNIDPVDLMGEVSYEDGGSYYGHLVSVEIDYKSKKIGQVTING